MTVTYSCEVATCHGLGNFHRLLRRWKGSIYKLVLPEMIVYIIFYAAISCFYRFYLARHDPSESSHKTFISIVKYCDEYSKTIPVSFILGFYVSNVVTRWWAQMMLLPWPDTLATLISTNLQGTDDRGRIMRRTMMRYLNLSFVHTMVMMSAPAKKRFPTLNHLVEAGFLLPHEQIIIENLDRKTQYSKYWIPVIWASGILSRARRENRWPDDESMNEVIREFQKWRSGLGDLLGYDWATIPLMYTQVVTIALYLYFLSSMLGKQFVQDGISIDLYVPFFLIVEFFFYMGWLKVAETMVNPFGEDDDDFEINWLIDRNLQVSYLIVDEMFAESPPLLKDQFWDDNGPVCLPYTEAAARYKTEGFTGSAKCEPELVRSSLLGEKSLDMKQLSTLRVESFQQDRKAAVAAGKIQSIDPPAAATSPAEPPPVKKEVRLKSIVKMMEKTSK